MQKALIAHIKELQNAQKEKPDPGLRRAESILKYALHCYKKENA